MVQKHDIDNVFSIVSQALEFEDDSARRDYLDNACSQAPEIRLEVDRLLQAHDNAGSFLQTNPISNDLTSCSLGPGSIVGPYKLIERIGEGGMGVVYMAEQVEPVRRTVAVKILKLGLDTEQVVARFAAERQAMAMMSHPHIAKVFDAGTTDSGRPYFVMELVKGIPITDFCHKQKLDLRQRLELFANVCRAVQHAHQKGIIHRDIKPGNVLVELHDVMGVPKVIDFGVAKAISQRLTEQTYHTNFAQMIGTPLYMSPEQAQLSGLDIDTRSDIYSLGVVLYELLTGTTPFEKKTMKQASYDELRRIIREDEPLRPSARVSTVKAELISTLSGRQCIDPKRLSSQLKGELDWIVMKALDKDRTRRYETASAFGQDIDRYLSDEPVVACPPTASYRFRKFARRNKVCLAFLSLIGLGLLGTAIGMAVSNHLISQRETDKQIALEQASFNLKSAVESEQKAQTRLFHLAKSNEILTSIFEDLNIDEVKSGLDPLEAVLAGHLVEAGSQLTSVSVDEPLLVADMQEKLGNALFSLGFAEDALGLFQESFTARKQLLTADHPDTLKSMRGVGNCLIAMGQYQNGLSTLERSLELSNTNLGSEHEDTLECMSSLAVGYGKAGMVDKAIPLIERTLEIKQSSLGLDDRSTLTEMHNLAVGYGENGQSDDAISLLARTVELKSTNLGADDPSTIASMGSLGTAYLRAGQLGKAVPLLERTLTLQQTRLGTNHPETLGAMNNLARGFQEAGQHDKASQLFLEALKLMRGKLGTSHPKTQVCMNNLANSYKATGQYENAIELLEECVNQRKAGLKDHPDTLTMMNNLGSCYLRVNQNATGVKLLKETVVLQRAKLGEDHPELLATMANLAGGHRDAGELDDAVLLNEQTLKGLAKKLPPDHPWILATKGNLASCYWSMNNLDKSIPLFEEVLEQQVNKLGRDHPSTRASIVNLGVNYKDAGRFDDAIPLLIEVYRTSKENVELQWIARPLIETYVKTGKNDQAGEIAKDYLTQLPTVLLPDHPNLARELQGLCDVYFLPLGDYAKAESILRQSLSIRKNAVPVQWSLSDNQVSLAEALLGQHKYAEAESLLLSGYHGLVEHQAVIPPNKRYRINQATRLIVQLYEALSVEEPNSDHVESAGKWRRQLEEHNE